MTTARGRRVALLKPAAGSRIKSQKQGRGKLYPETTRVSGSPVPAETLVSITPKITELISVTMGVILIFRATEDLIKWND